MDLSALPPVAAQIKGAAIQCVLHLLFTVNKNFPALIQW
jgi:hypothetical protein